MRRVLALLVLLALLPSAHAEDEEGGGRPGGAGGPPAMAPAPVEVATVVQKTVSGGRTFTGTVEPALSSTLGSEFGGLVVSYLVREGDRVEEGQVVAHLRTTLLDLRIEAARAQLESGKQRLAELENGSRPEEIEQARARVEQLTADLVLRKWKLQATEDLYEQKTVSEDELRDARLAVRASELLLDAARSAFDLVKAGPREEQIAQARAQVQELDAVLRQLEEEKARYDIKAPFAGWVVAEHTEVGQWLSPGSPVVEIVALDEVDVTVDVVEDYVDRLKVGLPARVTIEAIPGRVFTGTIHKIVPSADRRARTFPVKIRLPNERREDGVLLKDGMFASATLAVEEEKPALLVPKDAIVLGGMVPIMVWAVDPENSTAKLVPVQLGIAVDDLIEVMGPLKPGMQVVVVGNERIMFPGQPLKVIGR